MPLRNSTKQFKKLEDLDQLEDVVVDKRNHKRSAAKKNRRDRHYKKQFIKNLLGHQLDVSIDDFIEPAPNDKPEEQVCLAKIKLSTSGKDSGSIGGKFLHRPAQKVTVQSVNT